MSAASGLSFVRLPEIVRSTTFRWALSVAGAFALCIFLLFVFVYVQAAAYMTARADRALTSEMAVVSDESTHLQIRDVNSRLAQDPRRIRTGGLFAADGQRIVGNLLAIPQSLPRDGAAHNAVVERIDGTAPEQQHVRAVARDLPDGNILVIGRMVYETDEIAEIVGRALVMGLIPALALSILIGAFLALRAQRRVEEVTSRARRITAGDLKQRLPMRGVNDPFDRLSGIVNGMLEQIERLITQIAAVGDDIAHDLRTPLTRARIHLERGRARATTLEELQDAVDKGMAGLDHALAITTALLRLAEIEHAQKLKAFGDVSVKDLVRQVGDLYEPMADDKGIALCVTIPFDDNTIHGDRDLLFEAVANLVDNAIKFTPSGGNVQLQADSRGGTPRIVVADNGPGISAADRELVTARFYRSEKSRHTEGLGLGLSLVAAIVHLHGFDMAISTENGFSVEIVCDPNHRASAAASSRVH
jgi:signal transduction histidine kinase